MIGSCDYCGEYCAGLGVNFVEDFEFNGWIPPSAAERHGRLVMLRLRCAQQDGYDFLVRHVGPPRHDRRGRPVDECTNCANRSAMDSGDWDTTLDHGQCPRCWSRVAGGHAVTRWQAANRAGRGTPGRPRPSTSNDVGNPSPDRRKAEVALRAYAGVELPTVHWMPSPVEVVRALGAAIDKQGNAALDGRPASSVPPWSIRVLDAPEPRVPGDEEEEDEEDEDGLTFLDERSEHAAVIRCLATAIIQQRPDVVGRHAALVPLLLGDAGEFSAPFEPVTRAGPGTPRPLRPLIDKLRATTGAAVILPRKIVASERALRCSLDERGRPHATDGPAIAYRDGFTVFAWHGVVVPEWLIRDPERLDIETIEAEANVEVRRVMVERFGTDRLLQEGGAELVHEDETGRLWRRALPAIRLQGRWGPTTAIEEPMTFVEVVNSTPELDGTRRTYFLRVPPTVRTPREAVAWTFGLDGGEYQPAAES